MDEMKKVTEYREHSWKRKALLGLFVVVLVGLSYFFFVPGSQKEAYSYVTHPLKKSDLTLTISATGYLEPLERVDVGIEVSGTIAEVKADYNDPVTKGELLAVIDKTKYQSAVDRAQATLNAMKASLQNAQAQLYRASATIERDKNLKAATKGMLPSQQEWDNHWADELSAKAQVDNAAAQVSQARHSLVAAQYDLDRTMIYSPVDGIVLVRNIDPGQTLAASFQTPVLFQIAKDLRKMELKVSIDEADISKIKEGQKTNFSVDAYPELTFEGSIRLVRVNSEILDGVVTYIAVLTVDNSNLLLRPGMSADVDIIIETLSGTFTAPRSALLFTPLIPQEKKLFGFRGKETSEIDPKPHLWVLENGQPKKVYVSVLGSSGLLSAVASDELKAEQELIIAQEKKR
ncbi:MAG: efflux RND transporter periplasmic adaptor subunit [Campylobacterales bacterium]|nr:efflux RND transporter periplasmic adaptor subunit [Campylobacterales bacterium]